MQIISNALSVGAAVFDTNVLTVMPVEVGTTADWFAVSAAPPAVVMIQAGADANPVKVRAQTPAPERVAETQFPD